MTPIDTGSAAPTLVPPSTAPPPVLTAPGESAAPTIETLSDTGGREAGQGQKAWSPGPAQGSLLDSLGQDILLSTASFPREFLDNLYPESTVHGALCEH